MSHQTFAQPTSVRLKRPNAYELVHQYGYMQHPNKPTITVAGKQYAVLGAYDEWTLEIARVERSRLVLR